MQMTIQYCNDPRNPTGKYGNLKSTAGETIYVPVAMLPLFKGREGQAVDVPTKVATWGQGAEARQVTIATAGPNGGGWQGAQRGPYSQQPAQQSGTGLPTPQPQQSAPAYRPPAADKDGRAIFITGCVGRAMGSGKFTASEILVLTKAAMEAYDRYLDPNAKPAEAASAAEPPFNDVLPDHMLEPDGRQ